MKDKIQYEKAKNKLSIIQDLFEGITEYNNLTNYNNNKKFNFKISYFYDTGENCYKYTIEILRGIHDPQNILELRLQYKDKINDLLETMINNLQKNDKILYTSFGIDYNKVEEKFSINMKNDVSIDFSIKDEEDKIFYEKISKNFKMPTIIKIEEKDKISEEEKDKLQNKKASQTIKIIKKIINSLNEYNRLENYENTKPFKLIVSNQVLNDYTKFTFNILRGDYDNEKIADLSLSIKDTSNVYKELYELMLDYVCDEDFIYNTINNAEYKQSFNIHLKNGITLSFKVVTEKDKLFFGNFFNEYKHEIIDRKKLTLKTKTESNN